MVFFFVLIRELLAIVRVVLEVIVWVLPTRRYVVSPLSQVLMLVVEIWQRLRRICVESVILVIPMIKSW